MKVGELLLLLLPLNLLAGHLQEWQLKETASAPLLVTGRILSVHKKERVPEDRLSWKAETWAMTADVEVLRHFSASRTPLRSHQIQVRFLSYGPSVTTFVNGYPPPLPVIRPGEIRILPLRANSKPASEPWQLMANSGVDLIIPARAEAARDSETSPSARAFLIHEFANVLSRGTPGEVSALSGYLLRQMENLSGDLMPLLGPAIGDNRQQWAEIAASLHAGQSIPRLTVADIFAAQPAVLAKYIPMQGNRLLIQAALRKLQASSATDDLLVKTWIADAPFNAWGSANSLVDYADNPVTTDTLRTALKSDLQGSSYIAMVLANHGNKWILPEAIARAFQVIDHPSQHYNEVQGAAELLLNHGSEQDVTRLAELVRKYQLLDEKYYRVLWQHASLSNNPREMRVLAVVLADRRVSFGSFRYCDYALGEFHRLTKQKFDIEAASIPERNAAISRAFARIRESR